MVDTDQISTSADEPGLVIRNEDVFIAKVRERVALAEALGHLLSPVLLLQTGRGDELHAALAAATDAAGAPAATDIDQAGRTHAIWLLGPGPTQDALAALAGGGELVVADGNHRSLAAQTGGLPRFLAVVTTPGVGGDPAVQPAGQRADRHRRPSCSTGCARPAREVEPRSTAPVEVPAAGGTVHAPRCAGQRGTRCRLPHVGGSRLENLDHALVERLLLRDALGLDPGDKRITYVGGDYPASWLTGEVDAGRAELAVLIAPVTVDDFVAVNLARQKMPRKSTWFTPKARGGLVVAELSR